MGGEGGGLHENDKLLTLAARREIYDGEIKILFGP